MCVCDIIHMCDLIREYDMREKQRYGVATISRLLKIIGLFCKRAL